MLLLLVLLLFVTARPNMNWFTALGAEPFWRINKCLSCLQNQSHFLRSHVTRKKSAGIWHARMPAAWPVLIHMLMLMAKMTARTVFWSSAGYQDRLTLRFVHICRLLPHIGRSLERFIRFVNVLGRGLLEGKFWVWISSEGWEVGAEEGLVAASTAATVAPLALGIQGNCWTSKIFTNYLYSLASVM